MVKSSTVCYVKRLVFDIQDPWKEAGGTFSGKCIQVEPLSSKVEPLSSKVEPPSLTVPSHQRKEIVC